MTTTSSGTSEAKCTANADRSYTGPVGKYEMFMCSINRKFSSAVPRNPLLSCHAFIFTSAGKRRKAPASMYSSVNFDHILLLVASASPDMCALALRGTLERLDYRAVFTLLMIVPRPDKHSLMLRSQQT